MTNVDVTNVDVWMLSRHDGKGLFALAFPSSEKLVEYVIEYYSHDEPIEPLGDGEDVDAWLGKIAEEWGVELAIDHDLMPSVHPAPDGRNNLANEVSVFAHHSGIHDGINIEIDAPAGTRITVHLNDWDLAEAVVPE